MLENDRFIQNNLLFRQTKNIFFSMYYITGVKWIKKMSEISVMQSTNESHHLRLPSSLNEKNTLFFFSLHNNVSLLPEQRTHTQRKTHNSKIHSHTKIFTKVVFVEFISTKMIITVQRKIKKRRAKR